MNANAQTIRQEGLGEMSTGAVPTRTIHWGEATALVAFGISRPLWAALGETLTDDLRESARDALLKMEDAVRRTPSLMPINPFVERCTKDAPALARLIDERLVSVARPRPDGLHPLVGIFSDRAQRSRFVERYPAGMAALHGLIDGEGSDRVLESVLAADRAIASNDLDAWDRERLPDGIIVADPLGNLVLTHLQWSRHEAILAWATREGHDIGTLGGT